jgi:hypothetical protein
MRRALALVASLALATSAGAEITAARYTQPTPRYDHGVLGDALEWGALELTLADGRRLVATLPDTRVFEDLAPRLADLDGDGAPEVIVVETDVAKGAQLAIYDETGKIAATPFIGQRYRWLAPVGAADLDGDGRVEIAYIDRPHLAKVLRIWRFDSNRLTEVAALPGLTNHRIGDAFIQGGIVTCDGQPTILTADAGWTRIVATTFDGRAIASRDGGPYAGPESLFGLPGCR